MDADPAAPSMIRTVGTQSAPPHPLREMWDYFRQNRGAVIGLTVVCLIIFTALFANLILGAQLPTPEWGSMRASALEFIQSGWWAVSFPGLAILVSVLAFNLMGDGLRDALDPKLKR